MDFLDESTRKRARWPATTPFVRGIQRLVKFDFGKRVPESTLVLEWRPGVRTKGIVLLADAQRM